MTTQQLQNVYDARPFKPFNIHLADGRVLPVPHREFLTHSPSGRTVIVFDAEDNFSIIDLLLVTRLEVLAGTQNDKHAA